MVSYSHFLDAIHQLVAVPHFKNYIALISPKVWALGNKSSYYREAIIVDGCTPFATFDNSISTENLQITASNSFRIDLTPVFTHLGISDYMIIVPLLDQLCIDSDRLTVVQAVNSYILTALINLYEDRLHTEYQKWYHRNKHILATKIQTRIRGNNAMWKYPILEIIR